MNTTQRIIKYAAMAFGIFLAVNIICGILIGVTSVAGLGLGLSMLTTDNIELVEFSENFESVENIEIDVGISRLNIKIGDIIRVEASNVREDFIAEISKSNSGTLVIKDKKSGFNIGNIGVDNTSYITLYIPEDMAFDKITINTGVGESTIEYLHASNLEIEQGIGNMAIQDVIANNKCKIKGGVGKLVIHNAKLNDLKLETGVGELKFNGEITGDNSIECGIGRVVVDILGSRDDFKVSVDTGLGSLKIDGIKVADNNTYGNGKYKLDIEAGIGSADITFKGE